METTLPSGVHLKGFVDRLDRSPAGDLRVVDYKSGKSPSELFEGKVLFQLRFYALVLWRTTGVLPRLLRLYYLADREILVVSQFTLYGDARKGTRPSFVAAAAPAVAEPLYDRFRARLNAAGGVFGAQMQVALVGDGPVTLLVDSPG